MFTFRPLDVSLYFLDPEFGAVAIGAQVTHLGAIIISAERQNYFLHGINVAPCMAALARHRGWWLHLAT